MCRGEMMISRETLEDRYKALAQAQGVELEVMYRSGLPKVQEIEESDGGFRIRLDAGRISGEEYGEYLAYNVRKVLLSRLWLETDRLILRRFQQRDGEDCFPLFSSREDAYLDGGIFFERMDGAFDRLMDSWADPGQTRYVLELKETGRVIGTINLFDGDMRAVDTREIGYAVVPEYRRNGYAFEALSTLLHYLLYDLDLGLVTAGVDPGNAPSIRLLEKLGFCSEGIRHKAFWNEIRGPVDLMYYYLEKAD